MTELESIEQQIIAKRNEKEDKYRAYSQTSHELNELKRQRDRLRYNGMTKHEYLNHLAQNPEVKEIDGYTFTVKGYEFQTEFTTEEGDRYYFSGNIYKDSQQIYMSVTTPKGRNFTWRIASDIPKSRAHITDKLLAIGASLKVIEPDEDRDGNY